jgi:hypothetical protein
MIVHSSPEPDLQLVGVYLASREIYLPLEVAELSLTGEINCSFHNGNRD